MTKSLILLTLAGLLFVGCATDQTAEIERLEAEIAELRASGADPLPKSLENLFPPKADGNIWRMQMHAMATPLTAAVGSVQEGDMETAQALFAEFKKQYTTNSTLVPEWESKFDMAPVTAVEEAFAGGDPDAVMGAVMSLANVCHSCHYDNMGRVQKLYVWPKFSEVTVSDPDMGELRFVEVMYMLNGSITGIGLGLKEGSNEAALAGLPKFKKAFSLLEATCEECHDSERTYFVDEMVHNLIDRLEKTLSDPSATPQAAGSILQNIGNESCRRCHLVHVPAAFTQNKAAHSDAAMASH
jgi:cytochrome c556